MKWSARGFRRRAESVAPQLEKDGIPSPEIEIVAKGSATCWSRPLMGSKNRRIAVAFTPNKLDSAWNEALDRASVDRLPILFITWRRSSSLSGNGSVPDSRKYSFPTITVDGCDVVAVYRVASEAIEHARKDHGGTHIDCIAEKGEDPIRKMEHYLAAKGLFTSELKRRAATARKQLRDALSASNA